MKKCSWDLNLRLQGWRMEDRDEWNHWFIATAHEVIYFYCLVWISRLPRSAVLIDSKSGMGNSANPKIGIWLENFASEVKREQCSRPGRSWRSGSRRTGRRRGRASSRRHLPVTFKSFCVVGLMLKCPSKKLV